MGIKKRNPHGILREQDISLGAGSLFEVSEHEILQDCEQDAELALILQFVRERAGLLLVEKKRS
jgi:hypothetical protein